MVGKALTPIFTEILKKLKWKKAKAVGGPPNAARDDSKGCRKKVGERSAASATVYGYGFKYPEP